MLAAAGLPGGGGPAPWAAIGEAAGATGLSETPAGADAGVGGPPEQAGGAEPGGAALQGSQRAPGKVPHGLGRARSPCLGWGFLPKAFHVGGRGPRVPDRNCFWPGHLPSPLTPRLLPPLPLPAGSPPSPHLLPPESTQDSPSCPLHWHPNLSTLSPEQAVLSHLLPGSQDSSWGLLHPSKMVHKTPIHFPPRPLGWPTCPPGVLWIWWLWCS